MYHLLIPLLLGPLVPASPAIHVQRHLEAKDHHRLIPPHLNPPSLHLHGQDHTQVPSSNAFLQKNPVRYRLRCPLLQTPNLAGR